MKTEKCIICEKDKLVSKMIRKVKNSNNHDYICTGCNEDLPSIGELYPYNSETVLEQFKNSKDGEFLLEEKVTTGKNVSIIKNSCFHRILRDYEDIEFKIDTNTNNSFKEFDDIFEAGVFAKLISSTNSYHTYYIAKNENGKYYVLETENNPKDVGIIVSGKFSS